MKNLEGKELHYCPICDVYEPLWICEWAFYIEIENWMQGKSISMG